MLIAILLDGAPTYTVELGPGSGFKCLKLLCRCHTVGITFPHYSLCVLGSLILPRVPLAVSCPPGDHSWRSPSISLTLVQIRTVLGCPGLSPGWFLLVVSACHLSLPRISSKPSNSSRWDCGQWCPSKHEAVQPPLLTGLASCLCLPATLSSAHLHCSSDFDDILT